MTRAGTVPDCWVFSGVGQASLSGGQAGPCGSTQVSVLSTVPVCVLLCLHLQVAHGVRELALAAPLLPLSPSLFPQPQGGSGFVG